MTADPIVSEIHRLRAEEMERYDFDFDAFLRNLKEQERRSTKPLLPPPVSPPKHTHRQARPAQR